MNEQEKDHEIGRLKAELLRLRALIRDQTAPLAVLLRRRGFRIYRKEPADDLLLPAIPGRDRYYELLTRYSFRLFLRDVIKHQPLFSAAEVTRFATPAVTGAYLRELADLGVVACGENGCRLAAGPVKSFGPTLEWFVAETIRREFAGEAIWGAKMRRSGVGGDYDVLARLDGLLLTVEVKSSPPKQVYQPEIGGFFSRVSDLLPEVAVFFMDTELRMRDKLVPMFEEEFTRRHVQAHMELVERELFRVAGWPGHTGIYLSNASDGLPHNLELVLADWHRRRP